MKRTIATITGVIGIVLLVIAGCNRKMPTPATETTEPVTQVKAMFRANPQHTGVYYTTGVHQFSELMWKFKT